MEIFKIFSVIFAFFFIVLSEHSGNIVTCNASKPESFVLELVWVLNRKTQTDELQDFKITKRQVMMKTAEKLSEGYPGAKFGVVHFGEKKVGGSMDSDSTGECYTTYHALSSNITSLEKSLNSLEFSSGATSPERSLFSIALAASDKKIGWSLTSPIADNKHVVKIILITTDDNSDLPVGDESNPFQGDDKDTCDMASPSPKLVGKILLENKVMLVGMIGFNKTAETWESYAKEMSNTAVILKRDITYDAEVASGVAFKVSEIIEDLKKTIKKQNNNIPAFKSIGSEVLSKFSILNESQSTSKSTPEPTPASTPASTSEPTPEPTPASTSEPTPVTKCDSGDTSKDCSSFVDQTGAEILPKILPQEDKKEGSDSPGVANKPKPQIVEESPAKSRDESANDEKEKCKPNQNNGEKDCESVAELDPSQSTPASTPASTSEPTPEPTPASTPASTSEPTPEPTPASTSEPTPASTSEPTPVTKCDSGDTSKDCSSFVDQTGAEILPKILPQEDKKEGSDSPGVANKPKPQIVEESPAKTRDESANDEKEKCQQNQDNSEEDCEPLPILDLSQSTPAPPVATSVDQADEKIILINNLKISTNEQSNNPSASNGTKLNYEEQNLDNPAQDTASAQQQKSASNGALVAGILAGTAGVLLLAVGVGIYILKGTSLLSSAIDATTLNGTKRNAEAAERELVARSDGTAFV